MFTGIITDIGTIKEISPNQNGGTRLTIQTNYNTANFILGCSIAHNGACLTVTKTHSNSYEVDVSEETLACTEISQWKTGTKINLEKALRIGDELGGHMVLGHIDCVISVVNIKTINDHTRMVFRSPPSLRKFIATKGSVTLNGISLTVNGVNEEEFWVNLIPHTLQNTTFHGLKIGQDVNLEVDTVARYIFNQT